jgi:regulatory protein
VRRQYCVRRRGGCNKNRVSVVNERIMAERPVPAVPTPASLHAASLSYLARYAATEAGLRAVLERRIDRWARSVTGDRDAVAGTVAALKQEARQIAARLAASGLVNDAEYAQSRAAGLLRSGRSRRAVTARLAAKGVSGDLARAALPDDPDAELNAALVLARKRRIGPFRRGDAPDMAGKRREMAMLARAGFPQPVASKALTMTAEEAEARILAFRQ